MKRLTEEEMIALGNERAMLQEKLANKRRARREVVEEIKIIEGSLKDLENRMPGKKFRVTSNKRYIFKMRTHAMLEELGHIAPIDMFFECLERVGVDRQYVTKMFGRKKDMAAIGFLFLNDSSVKAMVGLRDWFENESRTVVKREYMPPYDLWKEVSIKKFINASIDEDRIDPIRTRKIKVKRRSN